MYDSFEVKIIVMKVTRVKIETIWRFMLGVELRLIPVPRALASEVQMQVMM